MHLLACVCIGKIETSDKTFKTKKNSKILVNSQMKKIEYKSFIISKMYS